MLRWVEPGRSAGGSDPITQEPRPTLAGGAGSSGGWGFYLVR